MRVLSVNAAQVLNNFLQNPEVPLYGYEIMQQSGMKSGSLYPILGRFERLGWIEGTLEPSPGGRPPRRVYTMNVDAIPQATDALDRFLEMKKIGTAEQLNWGF